MKKITIIQIEDDEQDFNGANPFFHPYGTGSPYWWDEGIDPCKDCSVRNQPFWNGICHCTKNLPKIIC